MSFKYGCIAIHKALILITLFFWEPRPSATLLFATPAPYAVMQSYILICTGYAVARWDFINHILIRSLSQLVFVTPVSLYVLWETLKTIRCLPCLSVGRLSVVRGVPPIVGVLFVFKDVQRTIYSFIFIKKRIY